VTGFSASTGSDELYERDRTIDYAREPSRSATSMLRAEPAIRAAIERTRRHLQDASAINDGRGECR
jgi:hypothetical protein